MEDYYDLVSLIDQTDSPVPELHLAFDQHK